LTFIAISGDASSALEAYTCKGDASKITGILAMKMYLRNPNSLKSRIKKLKQSLSSFEGLSPSLGLCRDLVAQSLNWADWNALYLGHKAPGSLHDCVMFTGRWYDGESNKSRALNNLFELISSRFGEVVTSFENKRTLAMLVWPASTSEFHNELTQNKVDTISVNQIPAHYLRDNILIDVDTKKSHEKFTEACILPFLSKNGGVIFCTPIEARSVIKHFHERGEQHGVIVDADYRDLVDYTFFFDTTIRHSIVWQQDEDNLMLEAFKHMLHQGTNWDAQQPNDTTVFCSWLSSKIKNGDSLSVEDNGASLCEHIHETSHQLINGVIDRLLSEQLGGELISLAKITKPAYPIVIISHSDSFLGQTVLSAFMQYMKSKAIKVNQRERSTSSARAPHLLVLGLGDQTTLSGFGALTIFSGASDWSVVIAQYNQSGINRQLFGTEMPILIANVSNIFRLKAPTIMQRCLMNDQSHWYCVRNGTGDLQDVMKSISRYCDKGFDIDKHIPPIPIKWK
jgi:hypothetical protein